MAGNKWLRLLIRKAKCLEVFEWGPPKDAYYEPVNIALSEFEGYLWLTRD